MKRMTWAIATAALLSACAHEPAAAHSAPRPTVALSHGTPEERLTAEQLERLFGRYDLSPWLYTRSIAIDEESIPHSHPVLTLHTRHLRDDLLLLSTYVHEQSHWYLDQHRAATEAAVAELKARVPSLPVGFPEGANSLESSYEHLLVIALEERALQYLVGELQARQVMEFWAADHYRALYRYVLDHRSEVRRVMRKNGLASPIDSPR
ncbi:hypothetical protein FGE12_12220 [Aggregicoccus sp. 17bor-14]|uniref:hypothetical protein n=1 Tax=Myxococcaceae TaxID=31 RepID=UPI00129C4D31|nr:MULTISPECIES: hypothetical protein [Myxococcaceae]MBF5043155.1 hypothetical protein [Simulacricoccus sp. 17bor-14]MRI88914.1 hypothetical protein [Aggregicoccus sp. 17bor-14]